MSSLESVPIDSEGARPAGDEGIAPIEMNPSAPAVMHASIWDTSPDVVKVPMFYTPASGYADTKKVSESSPSPPVVGYIVALPFSQQDHAGALNQAPYPNQQPTTQNGQAPMLGAALGIPQIPCACCKQVVYTGRYLETSKLSIVDPTAAMSGADRIAAPQHIDGELFRPCLCPLYYHRGCFREMRSGMSIFKNGSFYECPTCMFTYKLERIMGGMRANKRQAELGANSMTLPNQQLAMGEQARRGGGGTNLDEIGDGDIKWIFYRKIIFMWVFTLLFFIAGVIAIAAIAYGIDGDGKDIPVFIKMLLTSVSFTFPDDTSKEEWRAEFRRPDIAVWHYYGAFGVFVICCLFIILGFLYYCCCAPSNEESGGDINPSAGSIFCCSTEEEDREKLQAIMEARRNRQQPHMSGLSPTMLQAVGHSQGKRNEELTTYYGSQQRWYHFFACGRPTSFQYHDQRISQYQPTPYNDQPQPQPPTYGYGNQPAPYYAGQPQPPPPYGYGAQPNGGYGGQPYAGSPNQQPQQYDYERARREHEEQEEMKRRNQMQPQQQQQANNYSGGGTYYGGDRYYYANGDECCCIVCFCPSGRQHDRKDDCGSCNCNNSGGCDCGGCDCGLGDCGGDCCDCNCKGGGGGSDCGGGGDCGGAAAILLFVLLIVVIIIIISAILGLLVFLISRTFRLAGRASQLAYIQALEMEDHVFVLGINETWRPIDTV